MKKRLLSLLLAAGLLTGAALAVALGGSASDPLISLRYLEDTYKTSLLQQVQEKVGVKSDEVYQDVLAYLEEAMTSKGLVSQQKIGGRDALYADGFSEMRLKKGDIISGTTGTSVLLLAGKLSVSFSKGAVINVTTGKTVSSGTALTAQQRYLTGENAVPSFVIQSDTAVVSVDGYYTLQKSGATDYNQLADALYQMELFKGKDLDYGSGYALEDKANRIEGLIMFLRMLGQEKAALACKTAHPFTDVPAWCNGYVAYAYEKGYTTGVSSTAFGTYQEIGAKEYVTFLLRALGYQESVDGFQWNTSLDKAREVGVLTAGEHAMLSSTQFTRAQMVYVSYYGLLAPEKTGDLLMDTLINQGRLDRTKVKRAMAAVTDTRIS